MSIHIHHLNKHYGPAQALHNVSLSVPTGQLVALLGPSGCGKTTLLRTIAGLEAATDGQILLDGVDVSHHRVNQRGIGFMFQNYALFRHMSVFDNVAFGLQVLPRAQRPSKRAIHSKVMDLLQLVQLAHLAHAYPSSLSGGQRQRIALARSLAVSPKLLLLDEPFGALDAKVRKELRTWLRDIHHELGITSLLVTHDQEEALAIADQIVVMNQGRIEQVGLPEQLYQQPSNAFVTEFLGDVNAFSGRQQGPEFVVGPYRYPVPGFGTSVQQAAVAYVRPHELMLSRSLSQPALAQGQVAHIEAFGPLVRLSLRRTQDDGKNIEVLLTHSEQQQAQYQLGEVVALTPRQAKVFTETELAEFMI
ncbi:MAG: TOBE-like domain-containing protein [Neisseriaceae bacterium]|nr:TOBE-like domain-containing protein [Neisseriaceae bacterium]MBP6861200.1 TOBE-like domain-containing protein [Neisseriaceae bacterium]